MGGTGVKSKLYNTRDFREILNARRGCIVNPPEHVFFFCGVFRADVLRMARDDAGSNRGGGLIRRAVGTSYTSDES